MEGARDGAPAAASCAACTRMGASPFCGMHLPQFFGALKESMEGARDGAPSVASFAA